MGQDTLHDLADETPSGAQSFAAVVSLKPLDNLAPRHESLMASNAKLLPNPNVSQNALFACGNALRLLPIILLISTLLAIGFPASTYAWALAKPAIVPSCNQASANCLTPTNLNSRVTWGCDVLEDKAFSLYAASGTNFDSYPIYETQETKDGFKVLTSNAVGKRLEPGVSYIVTSNVTLSPVGYTAGLVANNNLIYIENGASLTVRGASGRRQNPGLPGIALTEGYTLYLAGEGSITCYGGYAGGGTCGFNGGNGISVSKGSWSMCYSGAGGNGGAGGGGGGAGIGTAGSAGGAGGAGGALVVTESRQSTSSGMTNQKSGNNGSQGQAAQAPAKAGTLCMSDALGLKASFYGGEACLCFAAGGNKGSSNSLHDHWSDWYYYNQGGGGGGGGGGSGSKGNAIGQGGVGGTGGSGGGSGGNEDLNRTRSTSSLFARGSGGAGGFFGGAATSNSRTSRMQGGNGEGNKTRCVDEWGGDGASTGVKSPCQSTGSSADPNKLRTVGANMNLTAQQWDGTSPARVSSNAYTVFNEPPIANKGWYLANPVFEPDATTSTFEIRAVVGTVTPQDLANQFEQYLKSLPQDKRDRCLGFRVRGVTDTYIYDAKTKTLNVDYLLSNNCLRKYSIAGSEKILWWKTEYTQIEVVYEQAQQHFNVCYHANGSVFTDREHPGTTVTVTEYTDTSGIVGQNYATWNNKTTGKYLVSPKDASIAKTHVLKWALAVDEKGQPTGSTYTPGEELKDDPKAGETVNLYAVWIKE